MLRTDFWLTLHQLGEKGFERFGDLRVQLLPSSTEKAAMSRVLHQRVLKGIDRIGRCAAMEDELGGDESSETVCNSSSGRRETVRSSG